MPKTSVVSCSVSLLACSSSVLAAETAAADEPTDTNLITSQRAERVSRGATGLDLEIKETPQSISVVTSQLMDDYGATSLNDALRLATGISVEEWETNRTNYVARGFEIKNTQIDGVGLPNNWGIVTGAMDAFGYEKLEVIRGANGLLTGVGNSSGTINYVRKRPTNTQQGAFAVEGGSWGTKRVQADYSTPFTDNGAWAGRVIVAYEDGDSWLRGLANDRTFVYGVVDGQLTERTTLTIGYSYQAAHTDGNMWGALTFANSDGTQAEWSRNASTTTDWTYWDTTNQNAFTELAFALNDRWSLKATYNYRAHTEDDKLFFAYAPLGLDPDNGTGLVGWPGKFSGNDHAHLGDLSLGGRFDALGREHEVLFGVSQAASMGILYTYAPEATASNPNPFGPLPAFPYAGNAVAEPAWGARAISDETDQRLRRVYGATRFAVTDRVKIIGGFNYAEYHREGVAAVPFDQTESKVSPYAGVTVDITSNVLTYASYSDIYQPQDYYDINNNYLDPSKGKNFELGVKSTLLDGKLLATLAAFTAEQRGLGIFEGLNSSGNYYYVGSDVDSRGLELELSGKLGQWGDIVLGLTTLKLEDPDGEKSHEWVPRNTANLAISSRLPSLPKLTLGANGRWQSSSEHADGYSGGIVRQDSYATLGLFGRWALTDRASMRANVNNVTDEKYIASLYEIGYYGAPRNYTLSVDYKF
jgi:outer membrane receptor for ferric coprogen and ferric-rhodotorulic acid